MNEKIKHSRNKSGINAEFCNQLYRAAPFCFQTMHYAAVKKGKGWAGRMNSFGKRSD